MEESAQRHFEAADRHERAAQTYERAAAYWAGQGDVERAQLRLDFARYERVGAKLERRWAALVDGQTSAAD